jgi:hypothetical protein
VELRVRYAGVPIGTLTLDAPSGLAHGLLSPGAGYELTRQQVETAGRLLAPQASVRASTGPPRAEISRTRHPHLRVVMS